jgi:hypothetical protein
MAVDSYTCPTCGAAFERAYQHCALCGQHYRGEHADCPGPIDWMARKAKARAFIRQELKRGQHWTSKTYEQARAEARRR